MAEIPKEIRDEAKRISLELSELVKNPEFIKRCKEFERKIHYISHEELLKEFTI